jgi:hypothetical protein
VATKFLAGAVVALAAFVLVPGAAAGELSADGAATPPSVLPGGSTLLTVAVTPLSGQPSGDIGVVCNLKPIGEGMTLLHDDGTNGDETAGDLTFSDLVAIPPDTAPSTLDFFCVANDGAGGAAELDIFVTVIPERPVNQAPTINGRGPYTLDEGGSVSLAAAGSDPEDGLLKYAWDLDSNGTFETPGQSVSFTADDGLATATVHVQVTDDGGLTAVGDATVTIKNVPPSATLGAPTSAAAGIPFMLSLSSPSDPSTADTDAGFAYAFDCGDGYGSFGPDSSQQCPATDVGTLSVGAEIQDKDGGITEYRASVAVTVTFDGLCDLVHAYSTDSKVADNLCNKLDEAASAPTESARAGALGAFRNMVDAKVGKGLTAEQAAELKLLSTQL